MTSQISFNSGYMMLGQYSPKDIENVAKYALGTNIVNTQDSPLSGMGLMVGIGGLMEAFKGISWLRQPGTFAEKWSKFVDASKKEGEIFRNGGWRTWKPYQSALHNYYAGTFTDMIPTGDTFTKLSEKTQGLFNEAEKLAQEAASSGGSEQGFEKAGRLLARANAAAAEELPTISRGFFGKIWQGVKNFTGVTWINKKLANYAVDSPLVEKFLRYGKGWGLFAGFQGCMELFTQVIPAFKQNGIGSGITQIFKSISNTVTSVLGWTLGFAGGSMVGALVAKVIGARFPGAGKVVGKLIASLAAFAGGCAGSWTLMKGSEKVFGKSEVDEAKERAAAKVASQAMRDPQKLQEIASQAQEKLGTNEAKTEDDKVAFGSLQRLGLVVPPVERKPRKEYEQNDEYDASGQSVGNAFSRVA